MTGTVWYKFVPSEFRMGTRKLTLEERGAYRLLRDLICLADDRLIEDDRYIAASLGCDTRVWRRIKRRLVELGKIACENGEIVPLARDGCYGARYDFPLNPDWPRIRSRVLQRDGQVCAYCGTATGPFEVDHVHPRALGGSDDLGNLAVACRSCNRSKRHLTLEQWQGRKLDG